MAQAGQQQMLLQAGLAQQLQQASKVLIDSMTSCEHSHH